MKKLLDSDKPEYQAFLSRGVGEGSNRQRKA